MNVSYVKPALNYAKMVLPSFPEIFKGVVSQNFPGAASPLNLRCPFRCSCPRRLMKLPAPLLINQHAVFETDVVRNLNLLLCN